MAGKNSTSTQQTKNAAPWTKEELRQIRKNEMDQDIFADRLFAQVKASPAFITIEQLDRIEKTIATDSTRRAALLFATKPGSELCKRIEEDRDFAVAVANVHSCLSDAKARYSQLADLLERIDAHLMVALCSREDMKQILEEAEA